MVLGMKSSRDKVLGGKINFWKKLLVGALISIIALVLSSVLNWIFFELVDPNYITGQMEEFMFRMEDMGLSEEQLDPIRESMEKTSTPMGQLMQNLKTLPIVALVISLIVAAFVKSDTTIDNKTF
jgi:cobalamin synthase